MARRLKRASHRRAAAWLLVVVAVTAGHGWVARELAEHRLGTDVAPEPLARMEVAFVRELVPAAPPPAAPERRPARGKKAAAPRLPASAPLEPPPPPERLPEEEPSRLSEPAPRLPEAEVAQAPVAAASAPGTPADAAAAAETAADAAAGPDTPADAAVAAETAAHGAAAADTPADTASDPVAGADAAPAATPPPAAAPAGEASADAASSPSFEWPPSTRLSYTLTGYYRGELHGSAIVQWVRSGPRYQVHLDIHAALLFSRRMTSDGELTDEGLKPRRYDEETKLAWLRPWRVAMFFDPKRIVLGDGTTREALPGVQDTASQFVQLTWLFTTRPQLLHVGNSIELPLALPRRVKRVTLDVAAHERLVTPVGELDAFHLKPRADPQPGSDLSAQMWFAPALQYLPVRIRIHQDRETFVDLMIQGLPLQAER